MLVELHQIFMMLTSKMQSRLYLDADVEHAKSPMELV
jgi:hypothetical protein